MDFKVGSRGWCYILERRGLRKGELCRRAILKYVPADAVTRYRRKLDRERAKLRRGIRRRMGEP